MMQMIMFLLTTCLRFLIQNFTNKPNILRFLPVTIMFVAETTFVHTGKLCELLILRACRPIHFVRRLSTWGLGRGGKGKATNLLCHGGGK